MQGMIYLSIVMMVYLLIYVLIGPELMACTLLFLIFLILAGNSNNETK